MSESIRVGAIGFGYWGPNLIRNLNAAEGADLVGICDSGDANRAKAQAAYPSVPTVSSIDELLTLGVDAVVIATSAPSHFELAKTSILAGKHTFVEKPLTLKSEDAAELVRLADEAGVTLMVGHLMLFHSAVEWIREYIASG